MLTCKLEDQSEVLLRHVVVDNIVIKGDKILLVKRASKLLEGGKWALVGGFVDRDETIKEAVTREIMEETGYMVEGITLLRIVDVPDRPAEDRQNISFVHFCTAKEKVGTPDNESDEQRWFSLSSLPVESEMAFDHLSDIGLYQEYSQKPYALPRFG